ncbi:PAS domain-containing protein [candidate division KSB1 bacterium]|nr:PAS domain-containing protein [candidate division KSB1 bacterium]
MKLENLKHIDIRRIMKDQNGLATILESIPHPFYIIDAKKMNIVVANSAAKKNNTKPTLCYALQQPDNQPCEAPHHTCTLEKVLLSREPVYVEHSYRTADNKVRYYEVHAFPIVDKMGEITHIIEYAPDITRRKETENRVRLLTQKLLDIQENEQQSFSRELHDHLAQDLSTAKILLGSVEDENAITKETIQRLDQIISGTITSIREMAYEMQPPGLHQWSFKTLLSHYVHEFSEKTGLRIYFSALGMNGLYIADKIKINLFRLVQEALSNINKHARASKVVVRIIYSSPQLILRIEDNGVGFNVDKRREKALEEKKMGIQSMVERVQLLNGTIDIHSRLNAGTKIAVKISVNREVVHNESSENLAG